MLGKDGGRNCTAPWVTVPLAALVVLQVADEVFNETVVGLRRPETGLDRVLAGSLGNWAPI